MISDPKKATKEEIRVVEETMMVYRWLQQGLSEEQIKKKFEKLKLK